MANSRDNDNEAKASIAPIVIGAVIVIAIGIIFGIKNYQNHSVNATRSQISTESSENGNLFTNDGNTSGNSGSGSGLGSGNGSGSNSGNGSGTNGGSGTSWGSGSGSGSGSNGGSHTKPNNGIIPGMEGLSDTSDFEDPYN